MTLRFVVRIGAHAELPPLLLDAEAIVVGSAPDADVRLPAREVHPQHARFERRGGSWRLVPLASLRVAGAAASPGEPLALALPTTIDIADVKISVEHATDAPTPPARTASLAREVVRAMVAAASGSPELVIEDGPATGARCVLDPPPSRLVVGRGEDADWIVLDPDLSRAHFAIERTWDRVVVEDLGSKNGTRVAGTAVPPGGAALEDGAHVEAGGTRVRYRDPAARYLAELARPPTLAAPPAPAPAPAPVPRVAPPASAAPFWIAIAICVLALGGLAWVLV